MGFYEILKTADLKRLHAIAEGATKADIKRALGSETLELEDFLALISPGAMEFIEPIALRAQAVTRERFGKVVQLYAPIYVSNHCTNSCLYCGFNRENKIARKTLTLEEVVAEARALHAEGFRNLLLVSGESQAEAPVERLVEIAQALRGLFPALSVEVYPLPREGYEKLVLAGVSGLTIYQETYDEEVYAKYHPRGPKADFKKRLLAPQSGCEAGMRRVGIGALMGLTPWRREAVALAMHAHWLQTTFWRTLISVSMPRLRSAAGGFVPPHPVSDADMVLFASAFRLFMPDAGLVLSTREAPKFRDGLSSISITSMSAGSKTEPGGYLKPGEAEEQFAVSDPRPPSVIAQMLKNKGLDPVWKDWDEAFLSS